MTDFTQLLNNLFSLYDKIYCVLVINTLGELVEQYVKNTDLDGTEENLVEQFRNIAFATSIVTFEGIRLILLDKAHSKILIININEETMILAIDKQATWTNILDIARFISDNVFY